MDKFSVRTRASGHKVYDAKDATSYEVGNFLLALKEQSDFSLEWHHMLIYFSQPSDVRYFVIGMNAGRIEK